MTTRLRVAAVGLVVLGLFTLAVSGARAQELSQGLPSSFAVQLARAKEIYVATQRKDGTQSSAAPVWFGVLDNGIYFATKSDSHKAKRIGRGSPAWVSVQGKHGPFIKMNATIVNDPALADRLGELYEQKYWIAWAGFFRPGAGKIEDGSNVLIKLTPQ